MKQDSLRKLFIDEVLSHQRIFVLSPPAFLLQESWPKGIYAGPGDLPHYDDGHAFVLATRRIRDEIRNGMTTPAPKIRTVVLTLDSVIFHEIFDSFKLKEKRKTFKIGEIYYQPSPKKIFHVNEATLVPEIRKVPASVAQAQVLSSKASEQPIRLSTGELKRLKNNLKGWTTSMPEAKKTCIVPTSVFTEKRLVASLTYSQILELEEIVGHFTSARTKRGHDECFFIEQTQESHNAPLVDPDFLISFAPHSSELTIKFEYQVHIV